MCEGGGGFSLSFVLKLTRSPTAPSCSELQNGHIFVRVTTNVSVGELSASGFENFQRAFRSSATAVPPTETTAVTETIVVEDSHTDEGLPTGALVGIVLACIFALVVLALIIAIRLRRRGERGRFSPSQHSCYERPVCVSHIIVTR